MSGIAYTTSKLNVIHEKLRQLPAVDKLQLAWAKLPGNNNKQADAEIIRKVLAERRRCLLAGEDVDCSFSSILADCDSAISGERKFSLRRVINATGVVLHTNLGRAPLSQRAQAQVAMVASGYSTLEFDLNSGERGSRYTHVEQKICRLTGAEAALVVNNNAAAVMLIISALASGGEVIVSRSELVEIGGSFRVPQVITRSGGSLIEVGTTNCTYIDDYEKAISENTSAILKIHRSNFQISGFTAQASDEDLIALAIQKGVPVINDIGSGYIEHKGFIPVGEQSIAKAINVGYDLVSFSGDKLLGGSQAGIIVGKRKYVEILAKDQLLRALRIDKLSLAALEGTLQDYLQAEADTTVPTQYMLGLENEVLLKKAKSLANKLKKYVNWADVTVEQVASQAGGGSLPELAIPGWAVALEVREYSLDSVRIFLRNNAIPIIVRVEKERLLIDVRCLMPGDDNEIVAALRIFNYKQ